MSAPAVIPALLEVLMLAERTIAASLKASGYQQGSCSDEWAPEIRAEIAALPRIRAALSRHGIRECEECEQYAPLEDAGGILVCDECAEAMEHFSADNERSQMGIE